MSNSVFFDFDTPSACGGVVHSQQVKSVLAKGEELVKIFPFPMVEVGFPVYLHF
jgi:hypothetical protein